MDDNDGNNQSAHRDSAAMWCDLVLSHIQAECAGLAVTRRAEIYMRSAGLPLDRVLDALRIDETDWNTRVAALRRSEEENSRALAGATHPALEVDTP